MRSGVRVLGLLVFAGCGFHSNADPDAAGPVDDAGDIDAPSIDAAPDACVSFAGQFDTCLLAAAGAVSISGPNAVFNTDELKLRVGGVERPVVTAMIATHEDAVGAIVTGDFQLTENAVLRAVGSRPFAIVASGRITLGKAAIIDVSNGGAGALSKCSTPAGDGMPNPGGGGGGGGGGYRADGGGGGSGNSDGLPSTGGGGAGSIGLLDGPQGGCAGGAGGAGNNNVAGGAGGPGGGAIYLVAADRIELGEAAVLTAGGGGGKGGVNIGGSGGSGDSGGGGGGSGGMVLLEAPRVSGTQAVVAANGGGGGEGASSAAGGEDGKTGPASEAQASGGQVGPPTGGDGGRGGSKAVLTGETVLGVFSGGGGGGGGGVGYIRVVSPESQLGVLSPPASQ